MKRAVLALPFVAIALGIAWPIARDAGAEVGVCAQMTPARMLENPALAQEYAAALGSGDAADLARVEHLLREIRAVHGCDGEVGLPAAPSRAPELPPGHPPLEGGFRWREAPRFEAPAIVTI